MALISKFVGIDRYSDIRITDLTGAKRDGIALWALFIDTVNDIQAELLTDNRATYNEVVRALDESLGAATPDDTVIFTWNYLGLVDG